MSVSSSVKSMELLLRLADWFLSQFLAKSCYMTAVKIKTPSIRSSQAHQSPSFPSFIKSRATVLSALDHRTLVCDVPGCLLRSRSFFPYFMLVAFEAGGILRALVLLLSCPILYLLDYNLRLRSMIFITFCGLRVRDMDSVSRAVLPKFYLEDLNLYACQAVGAAGFTAVVTDVPRVMVEGFLKEYLGVDRVVGTELQTAGRFFTGLVGQSGLVVKHRAVKEVFGEKIRPDFAIGSSIHDQLFISLCKEAYMITTEESKALPPMPRGKYPKSLVFHDGRLAFLPTPAAMLSMFLWLPFGVLMAVFRLLVGICLPYRLALLVGTATGVTLKVHGRAPPVGANPGVLYVCTHRTLLDPVFLSTALKRPLTAVTYSLSRMSELIAPIRTVRLTRNRLHDGDMMRRLLAEGDLVVCPEGTTCREPYLLRFSPLFAELADDIVPVAVDTGGVSMFYGTTASGLKWLDPIFFLMNPRPSYVVRILDKLPREMTCGGGKPSVEVANDVQRRLAAALGFECTNFTRRDKYLMLAGNEGIVNDKRTRNNKP